MSTAASRSEPLANTGVRHYPPTLRLRILYKFRLLPVFLSSRALYHVIHVCVCVSSFHITFPLVCMCICVSACIVLDVISFNVLVETARKFLDMEDIAGKPRHPESQAESFLFFFFLRTFFFFFFHSLILCNVFRAKFKYQGEDVTLIFPRHCDLFRTFLLLLLLVLLVLLRRRWGSLFSFSPSSFSSLAPQAFAILPTSVCSLPDAPR